MQMISAIENAMVDAIKAAADAATFNVRSIESYGGQLDDGTLDWIRALPAIWVVFSGCERPTASSTAKGKWRYPGVFTVFCAQRNLAGNKALRQGDARNPGVYALMQLVVAALQGRDLGLEIKEFEPGKVAPHTSFGGKEASMVYTMNWHTSWLELSTPPEPGSDGWIESIGLKYFRKPGDNVADAADLVTLTPT